MMFSAMLLAGLFAAVPGVVHHAPFRSGDWKDGVNLVRDDFVLDNWGGVVGWDATSKTRVSTRVEVLDELSPNGKPVLRLMSEELFDNSGLDGMNVRTDGSIGLKNGEQCRFSAYVRTKNLPKGQSMCGLFLHGTPWKSDVHVNLPLDTGGKWVKIAWEGKLNLSNYAGRAQLSFYTEKALGDGAYIDVAEPFLSGSVTLGDPGTDMWELQARPGRLTPFDPVLDEINAADAKMTFYYPGSLVESGEKLVLRAKAGGKTVFAQFGADHKATVSFGRLEPGRFDLKAELVGAQTGRVQISNLYRARARLAVKNPTPLKRLNNYVKEIFSEPLKNGERSFVLEKDSWVYFGFSRPVPSASVAVDDAKDVVVRRPYEPQEGMRLLTSGHHVVKVMGVPDETEAVFSARVVKPILRCGLHLSGERKPNFNGYCYGEEFWRKLGLYSGFNMVSCLAKRMHDPALKHLLDEMEERGVGVVFGYGMGGWDPRRKDYEAYLDVVTNNVAYQERRVLSFDENSIVASVGKSGKINTTEIWWQAYGNGHPLNVFFEDGATALFCNPMYDTPELSAYANSCDGKGLIFTEAYFRAVESQAGFDRLVDFLRVQMRGIRKALPAAVSKYSYMLSGWAMNGAWSPWYFTDVDMRAMLGEVCHVLATDPEFDGNGGLTFSTPACWEDFFRFVSAGLIRYYCIEGGTGNFAEMNGLKLMPGHLKNGDFLDGFDGWTTEPAEVGSISLGEKRDYGSRWQGRQYPRTYKATHKMAAGDRFAALTRSEKTANRLRQKLVNLEPGRVYQLVYTAADRETVEKNFLLGNTSNADCKRRKSLRPIVLEAKVIGAETIDDLCHTYTNFAKYGIGLNRTTRLVFRATAPEAEVEFSDWKSEIDSGAPTGTVTWLNYIMVHPYYYRDEMELKTLKELFRRAHQPLENPIVASYGR